MSLSKPQIKRMSLKSCEDCRDIELVATEKSKSKSAVKTGAEI
jgi:hypothetical protein